MFCDVCTLPRQTLAPDGVIVIHFILQIVAPCGMTHLRIVRGRREQRQRTRLTDTRGNCSLSWDKSTVNHSISQMSSSQVDYSCNDNPLVSRLVQILVVQDISFVWNTELGAPHRETQAKLQTVTAAFASGGARKEIAPGPMSQAFRVITMIYREMTGYTRAIHYLPQYRREGIWNHTC